MKNLTGTVKTIAPLPVATLLSPAPEVPQVPVQSLVDILIRLKNSNGSLLLDYNQALTLTALKFERGDNILTLEDRPFVYEAVNMLYNLDYEIVYNFLNAGWDKVFGASSNLRNKIIFENPLLEKSKDRMAMDMEIYRNKIDIGVGSINCPKCHSMETLAVERQVKRADEPASIFCSCTQCKYKWTAQ